MNRKTTRLLGAITVPVALALGACTTTSLTSPPQPVYPTPTTAQFPAPAAAQYPVQRTAQYDEYGIVRNITLVQGGSGAPNLTGAVIGGVLGAVAGNQIGGGSGRTVATAAGAIGGAVIGNQIQNRQQAASGQLYRVDVQTESGQMQSFQYQDLNGVQVGDRVRIYQGQLYRG